MEVSCTERERGGVLDAEVEVRGEGEDTVVVGSVGYSVAADVRNVGAACVVEEEHCGSLRGGVGSGCRVGRRAIREEEGGAWISEEFGGGGREEEIGVRSCSNREQEGREE